MVCLLPNSWRKHEGKCNQALKHYSWMFPNISIQMFSIVEVMYLIACLFHILSGSFDALRIKPWLFFISIMLSSFAHHEWQQKCWRLAEAKPGRDCWGWGRRGRNETQTVVKWVPLLANVYGSMCLLKGICWIHFQASVKGHLEIKKLDGGPDSLVFLEIRRLN